MFGYFDWSSKNKETFPSDSFLLQFYLDLLNSYFSTMNMMRRLKSITSGRSSVSDHVICFPSSVFLCVLMNFDFINYNQNVNHFWNYLGLVKMFGDFKD